MSLKINYEKARRSDKKREAKGKAVHNQRLYGSHEITQKQYDFFENLTRICKEKGIKIPSKIPTERNDARSMINGLIEILKKHGYDANGNYLNNKQGFLAFMENER